MPNPPPGSIVHRQGRIIWDPYIPCPAPVDEIEWLWNPLRQQLEAIVANILDPLSAKFESHIMGKKAETGNEIREMTEAWLKGMNTEETVHEASRLIHIPGTHSETWETQLLDNVCILEQRAQKGGGTKKITILPCATFRVLREEECKRRRQITLRLRISFTTERFAANNAEPVDYYAYHWYVDHDLWLERRSWRSRAASIISSVVPTVSSSFWSTQSSQATGPGHGSHTEAVMRPDASCGTSLAGSTAPTKTQLASIDGLLPGESDSFRRDVLADSKC
jgi:hypothetical protein